MQFSRLQLRTTQRATFKHNTAEVVEIEPQELSEKSIVETTVARACASFILDPSCKRDPKNFLQTGSEPRADTGRFNLFIDNNATSLRLL